jgi:hypothetical protein
MIRAREAFVERQQKADAPFGAVNVCCMPIATSFVGGKSSCNERNIGLFSSPLRA